MPIYKISTQEGSEYILYSDNQQEVEEVMRVHNFNEASFKELHREDDDVDEWDYDLCVKMLSRREDTKGVPYLYDNIDLPSILYPFNI